MHYSTSLGLTLCSSKICVDKFYSNYLVSAFGPDLKIIKVNDCLTLTETLPWVLLTIKCYILTLFTKPNPVALSEAQHTPIMCVGRVLLAFSTHPWSHWQTSTRLWWHSGIVRPNSCWVLVTTRKQSTSGPLGASSPSCSLVNPSSTAVRKVLLRISRKFHINCDKSHINCDTHSRCTCFPIYFIFFFSYNSIFPFRYQDIKPLSSRTTW